MGMNRVREQVERIATRSDGRLISRWLSSMIVCTFRKMGSFVLLFSRICPCSCLLSYCLLCLQNAFSDQNHQLLLLILIIRTKAAMITTITTTTTMERIRIKSKLKCKVKSMNRVTTPIWMTTVKYMRIIIIRTKTTKDLKRNNSAKSRTLFHPIS